MRRKITLLLLTLVVYVSTNAQRVGIGTTSPNPGAALDISSTTGSLLIPRMTTTQRDAITPTPGMLIQNITLNAMQAYSTYNPGGSIAIDQSQTGGSSNLCVTDHAQSFTTGASGSLFSITVLIESGSGPATLNIYNGGSIGGEIIFSQAVNITAAAGTEQEFILSSAPVVTSGSVYTFEITGGNCSFNLRYSSSDSYAGGELFNEIYSVGGDLYFKTKVLTLPSGGWKTLLAGNSTNFPGTGSILPPGGTTGNTLYWNGTSWVYNSSNIFNNGGNVGIGTISPSAKLTAVKPLGNAADFLSGDTIKWTAIGIGRKNAEYVLGIASDNDNFLPGTKRGDAVLRLDDNTKKIFISPWGSQATMVVGDGKVGIGTTTPGAKLDIAGQVKITGGTPGAGKVLTSDASGLATWQTPSMGTGTAAGNTPYWNGTAWVTNNSNIYNNGGNVGIGTSTPGAKLEVAGQVKITGGTPGAGKVLTSDASGLATWQTPSMGAGTAAGNTPYWNGTAWVTNSSNIYNNGGNVGIGIATPTAKLHVGGNQKIDGSYALELGGDFIKEVNAGKIAYQLFTADALDILGAGTTSSNRKIKFWAEGGTEFTGNVGIGTSTPVNKLSVTGNANFTGNVGIGTSSPNAKLHIEGTSGSVTVTNFGYLNNSGAGVFSGTQSGAVSIYASGRIVTGTDMVSASDERIKNIAGPTNTAEDMNTLNKIAITNYTYKDQATKGNATFKKVIAQQVEKVYPLAVTTTKDVIPDIYKNTQATEGWIQLANTLKTGDKVRIYDDKGEKLVTVNAATSAGFTIDQPITGNIFVYGKQTDDFRVVDYDAISMLNVSATQELYKLITALKEANEKQKTDYEKRLKEMEEKLNRLVNGGAVTTAFIKNDIY